MANFLGVVRGRARMLSQCLRLDGFAPTSRWADFATAAVDERAPSQPSTSGQETLIDSKQLTAAHVGSYYALNPALLPEANRAYAGAFLAPRDPGHERRGGCKALQQEVEATRSHSIMYRNPMHALYEAVGVRSHPRLLLTGPAGSGKSIALVGLVEWARQKGWLVVYVPSCVALVRGGYFAQRGTTGRFDTLTSAQQILKGLLEAHGEQLKGIPADTAVSAAAAGDQAAGTEAEAPVGGAAGGRTTLYDMALAGLAKDDDAQLAVDSVMGLVRQLAAASVDTSGFGGTPVLFALDDYNCLYGASDYGTYSPDAPPSLPRRKVLSSDQLVLASGMRLLDAKALGAAVVVAATTTAAPLPAPTTPPLRLPYTELVIPGFSEAETGNALAHYHARGHAIQLADSRQARRLHALTQGNARELRTSASTLGLSLQ